MNPEFKNKEYVIEEFIDLVRRKGERSSGYDPDYFYDVYGAEPEGQLFSPGKIIYVGDTVQATDEGEDVYPEAVRSRGLSFLYSSENFQAVVDLAVNQDGSVLNEKLIECLNYYAEHDDFMDV